MVWYLFDKLGLRIRIIKLYSNNQSNDFLLVRKNVKSMYTNINKKSSTFKWNFYTWIWVRIQQLKLMRIRIRNPVTNIQRVIQCLNFSNYSIRKKLMNMLHRSLLCVDV
jgi:hypothetical protein